MAFLESPEPHTRAAFGRLLALTRRNGGAQQPGRYSADLAHAADGEPASTVGDAHHPADDTGRLVFEAYRSVGAEEMRAGVRDYQAGYNARAADHGDYAVRWPDIKNGIS